MGAEKEPIPQACITNLQKFSLMLNAYRAGIGRDVVRRLEAPAWPSSCFGEDLDEVDSAFQQLRNRYGDSWLKHLLSQLRGQERVVARLQTENQELLQRAERAEALETFNRGRKTELEAKLREAERDLDEAMEDEARAHGRLIERSRELRATQEALAGRSLECERLSEELALAEANIGSSMMDDYEKEKSELHKSWETDGD